MTPAPAPAPGCRVQASSQSCKKWSRRATGEGGGAVAKCGHSGEASMVDDVPGMPASGGAGAPDSSRGMQIAPAAPTRASASLPHGTPPPTLAGMATTCASAADRAPASRCAATPLLPVPPPPLLPSSSSSSASPPPPRTAGRDAGAPPPPPATSPPLPAAAHATSKRREAKRASGVACVLCSQRGAVYARTRCRKSACAASRGTRLPPRWLIQVSNRMAQPVAC